MTDRDLVAAVVATDPNRIYREALRQPGIVRNRPRACWVAAHPRDVQAVLSSERCVVRPPGAPVPSALVGTAAGEMFSRFVRMIEGERHHAVKRAIVEAVNHLDPAVVQRVCRHHATAIAGQADLDRLLVALPVSVVASLLGVPDADLHQVVTDTSRFVRAVVPGASANDASRGCDAAARLYSSLAAVGDRATVSTLFERLRHALLAAGHHDGGTMIANAICLLFQSHDATAGLIGNTLVWLVRHPATARTRDSVTWLVAEMAHVDPAVHNTRRYANGAVSVNGVELHGGEEVLVSLAAANTENDGESWSFGAGRHACPARALALTIAREGVLAVCEQGLLPDQLPEPMTYRPLGNVRIPVFED